MPIPVITTAQTDAGSPLNETLMEGLRQRSLLVPVGAVTWVHDFNGLINPPEGFMKANGQLCNEANYDSEHGAGTWDLEVGTSPLDGLYLPNLVSKYAVGSSTTPQTGETPIPSVGNTSHEIAFTHTHTANHNHKWYESNGNNAHDQTYNSGGAAVTLPEILKHPTSGGPYNLLLSTSVSFGYAANTINDSYTDNDSTTSSTGSVATKNIQPESIALIPYIRIV